MVCQFFKEIKQAPAACVHFYRPATFRCNIIDKHMRRCAAKYVECKFVKIIAMGTANPNNIPTELGEDIIDKVNQLKEF